MCLCVCVCMCLCVCVCTCLCVCVDQGGKVYAKRQKASVVSLFLPERIRMLTILAPPTQRSDTVDVCSTILVAIV